MLSSFAAVFVLSHPRRSAVRTILMYALRARFLAPLLAAAFGGGVFERALLGLKEGDRADQGPMHRQRSALSSATSGTLRRPECATGDVA